MSVRTLEILYPGFFTTVQDTGRYGYQRFGMPPSGAMDAFALRASNILVGNEESAAGLEITIVGPKIKFLTDAWIAITGGDLQPVLDGDPLVMWQTIRVPEGAILSFGKSVDGARSYLAVAGGLDTPLVMGSRSTYVMAGIGGIDGRPLAPGDTISTFSNRADVGLLVRGLPDSLKPPYYGHQHEIMVMLGPKNNSFTAEAIATFLGSEYTVGLESDRVGYKLDGPRIGHREGPDIISEGSPVGAVQIPGDGRPIILLADRGPTGGYAKIATVVSSSINTLGQAMPGDCLKFKAVTAEEAQAVQQEDEGILAAIKNEDSQKLQLDLGVLVGDEAFEVYDESGTRISSATSETSQKDLLVRHAKATIAGVTYEFDVGVRGGRLRRGGQ